MLKADRTLEVAEAMMARSIKTAGVALASGLFFASQAQAQSQTQTALETIPFSSGLPPYKWFASTDAKHENNDYVLLKPGETRRVPLTPGRLERLWSTSLFPDQIDMTLDAGGRRVQLLLSGGKTARGLLQNKAYTFFPTVAGDSLANLKEGATLIATNKSNKETKWFYQVAVRPAFKKPAVETSKESARRQFKMSLGAGESKSIEKWDSPGEIYEISVAPDSADKVPFDKIRLKASFDGQPAVDAPLFSLAGQISGVDPIQNAAADFDGSRLLLLWPMPFAKAELTLVNESDKAQQLDVGVRVREFEQPPSLYRFCAVQQHATSVAKKPVSILNLQGEGIFAGMALAIAPGPDSTRRTFAYLEGNELINADGRLYEGTGTEDYFTSAWYFPDKPFSLPFEGLTEKKISPPSVSAYRLQITDALPFKKSLKFDFEHGNGNNSAGMDWTWTAYWYQKPPLAKFIAENSANSETKTASEGGAAPVASGDQWKIWVAVALGVILGTISNFFRRRRKK